MPTNDHIPADDLREMEPAPIEELPAARSVMERVPDELLMRVRAVSSREDAAAFAVDVWGMETAQVIIKRLNAAINLPYIPEAVEAFLMRRILEVLLYLYHKAT